MISTPDQTELITVSRKQLQFADWMTAILLYTIILNLFVEYAAAVIIDSFTISIFTAIVLKALLDIILRLEHRVSAYFGAREGTVNRVLQIVLTFAILFLSKFVILEVIDIIFGEHVELGGFITLVAMIITMLVSERVVHLIYGRLGPAEPGAELGQ